MSEWSRTYDAWILVGNTWVRQSTIVRVEPRPAGRGSYVVVNDGTKISSNKQPKAVIDLIAATAA